MRIKDIFQAIAITIGLVFLGLVVWRIGWVTFIDNYELGFVYDRTEGTIKQVPHTGYIIRAPFFYDVHTIDTRPVQVCFNANFRVLNCKLVKFDPAGLNKFVEWHGRSAGDDTNKLHEILKSYAFNVNEGKDCPFLTITDEMRRKVGDQIPAPTDLEVQKK